MEHEICGIVGNAQLALEFFMETGTDRNSSHKLESHSCKIWSLSLSLRRRSSWLELVGLHCVDGIPHDRGPCTAVLGHLGVNHRPLP